MIHVKRIGMVFFVLFGVALVYFCGRGYEVSKKPASFRVVHTEQVHVDLEKITTPITIAYLSDLHIITCNEEIAPENQDMVSNRLNWSAYDGMTAAEALPYWIDYINELAPELVLLGGDMIDYSSKENLDLLEQELCRLKMPYVYVRADHDTEPFWVIDTDPQTYLPYQNRMDGHASDDVWYVENEQFIVLAWNNSTSQMTEEGLSVAREAMEKEKPILLLTHVPLQSQQDYSLDFASREAWQDRSLIWGQNTTYTPNETTSAFMDLVYAPNSPVREVFSGHLHFTWDGMLTPTTHQHVFSAAYERNMGLITLE